MGVWEVSVEVRIGRGESREEVRVTISLRRPSSGRGCRVSPAEGSCGEDWPPAASPEPPPSEGREMRETMRQKCLLPVYR